MTWKIRSEALPLGDVLVRSAQRTPDAVALAFPDEHFTYDEVLERTINVARGLVAIGVESGDNVGILAPNSIEYVAALFGTALIGAVAVPINARSTSRELEFFVDHGQLAAMLTTDRIDARTNFRDRLAEALPGLADADASEPLSLDGYPHLRGVVMLRGTEGNGCVGAREFKALASSVDHDEIGTLRGRVRLRNPALILYTSGTTSNPKGCIISHEAISRGSLARIAQAFPFDDDNGRVVMWCTAPLFHIAALQGFVYAIGTGSTFVTDVYLDADRALASIKQWRTNTLWPLFMPPFRTLKTAAGFDPTELDFVTSMVTVGPVSELEEWQGYFPQAMLVNGAGMSETAGWFCLSARDDTFEHRTTSAGKPVDGAQVRVVNPETGEDQVDGERGELLVKTYTMLDGYFRDPERTAEAIDEDGWLHTGDLFTRFASGHFAYSGRIKDMLKVGGENVPAIEVESYLCRHAAVNHAEVIGMPDPRLDEVPIAFIELTENGTATEDELIAFCAGELSTFKVPRAIHFIGADEWPMSASKVNKPALRAEAERRATAVTPVA